MVSKENEMENQGTVKVKFPRETDTKSGWTVDPSFIARVRHSIPPDEDEWVPSHEEVQSVLLALEVIPAGALQVIDTVDGEDAAECEMLMELQNKIKYAIEAAHGIKE